ncbi:MAG: type II toxin-antitoxin system RelB/DinJ family antitoxin [Atopobiaceae bacterium]|nr:type II toxin-antitoxin system RelB/DinJ family antitoxin [Atopobiaceae bacterium]
MANTSAVYARIDSSLKANAEAILNQLGITPSAAIQMLYSQVVINRGLPFTPRLPAQGLLFMEELTEAQLEFEVEKGLADIADGKVLPADEVDLMLAEEFGI